MQRTDVSDSHVDRSHAVRESLAADVYVASPMLPPCTVKLAEPVAALFVGKDALSGCISTENAKDTDPTLRPTDIDILLLPNKL